MRVRRGLLFWGLFLIPLGAIPLLARAGYIDVSGFADVWRFWPLILIGLGLMLLIGRRSLGLVVVAATALLLGSLAGAAISGADLGIGAITPCIATGDDDATVQRDGTFSAPATVVLELDCGDLDLTTAPGSAWSLQAAYRGAPPAISDGAAQLRVSAPEGFANQHQDWTLTTPTDQLRVIELSANAGTSALVLTGAALDRIDAELNAGDIRIDGTGATIDRLDVGVNAGRARVTLDSTTDGELSVNAGAIDLCVPPDAALELEVPEQFTFATNLDARGLTEVGEDTWTRQGTGARITLSVEGNAASFTLDPEGGCQ
jgi:hypothetical protein